MSKHNKTCTKHVQSMYKTCTKQVQNMYKTCTKHVQNMYHRNPFQKFLIEYVCLKMFIFKHYIQYHKIKICSEYILDVMKALQKIKWNPVWWFSRYTFFSFHISYHDSFFKGTVCEISRDPCTDDKTRFTTIYCKALSNQVWIIYQCLLYSIAGSLQKLLAHFYCKKTLTNY